MRTVTQYAVVLGKAAAENDRERKPTKAVHDQEKKRLERGGGPAAAKRKAHHDQETAAALGMAAKQGAR